MQLTPLAKTFRAGNLPSEYDELFASPTVKLGHDFAEAPAGSATRATTTRTKLRTAARVLIGLPILTTQTTIFPRFLTRYGVQRSLISDYWTEHMKLAHMRPILLALATTIVLAIAPSPASAIGPGDVLPKPTVTGLPELVTNLPAVTFTLSTTVSSAWFVDFSCAYDSSVFTSCDSVEYPTCVPAAGAQKTCSQTIARAVAPGSRSFRFRAQYCDDPTLSECEDNLDFHPSATEAESFYVDRTNPIVTISSGPDRFKRQVIKAGTLAFSFYADGSSTTTCATDASPLLPCKWQYKVPTYLKNGDHTFSIVATDWAGNQTTATRKFRVDVFHPKKCKKGSSKRAKSKRKKCVAKNAADRKAWKKKHGLK